MRKITDKIKSEAEANDALFSYGKAIVCVDNAFVHVGDVFRANNEMLISGAKCIRKWGTKNGLGQLINGPTKETILEDEGEIIVPLGRVVKIIPVNPAKW